MAIKVATLSAVTVATAGVRVQVTSQTIRTPSLIIQASPDNTGNIFVGDSNVADGQGVEVSPCRVYEFTGDNIRGIAEEVILSDFYIDAQVNGDKANVQYVIRR